MKTRSLVGMVAVAMVFVVARLADPGVVGPTDSAAGPGPAGAPGNVVAAEDAAALDVSFGASPAVNGGALAGSVPPAVTLVPVHDGETIDGVPSAVGKALMADRAKEEAAFYLAASALPSNNQVVPAGLDPLVAASRPTKNTETYADGTTTTVELSSFSAVAGEDVVVRVQAPGLKLASATARLFDTAMTGYLEEFPLQPSGDLSVASATWTLPAASLVALDPGHHALVVTMKTVDGHTRTAQTTLTLGTSSVFATGRYRESVVDGSLVIGVEVRATGNAPLHLAASLATTVGADTSHAIAQRATRVSAGFHWIDLTFHGRAVRALGNGPYRLVAVQLHDTTRMPPARLPIARPTFTTAAYAAERFRNDPFREPGLVAMARFLEPR